MRSPGSASTLVLMSAIAAFASGCSSDDDPTVTPEDPVMLAAALVPSIPEDVSGEVSVLDAPGFSDDRLDVEIEIDADAFGALGIDEGDGFDDETVTLFHGVGVETAITSLAFSEDRRVGGVGDVTFEASVDGQGVPALVGGDVVWVRVNGVRTVEGVLL